MSNESPTLEEVAELVSELNGEIYDQIHIDGYAMLSMYYDGWVYGVEFLGIPIWDSDNDDRPSTEWGDIEVLMSLDTYIKCEINKWVKRLKKIDLVSSDNTLENHNVCSFSSTQRK